MSLVTRCPKCQSDFMVQSEQLRIHEGLVRCGSCTHIFDGFAALQNQLPTLTQRPEAPSVPIRTRAQTTPVADFPAQASPRPIASAPASTPSVLRHRSSRVEPNSLASDHEPFSSQPDERLAGTAELSIQGESRLRTEGTPVGRTQPEFLIDEVDTQRLKMLLWSLASALAFVLLVVQLAYIYRNDLATQMPSLRPTLDAMCSTLKCEVSLRRQLERISVSVIAFERQAAAGQEGKPVEMTLKFSMRNRLNLPQPWPHLSLELTDASGTVVLRKPLSPREYLPATLADKPFAASQDVTLNVPMTVTGLQINGYSLKPFFP